MRISRALLAAAWGVALLTGCSSDSDEPGDPATSSVDAEPASAAKDVLDPDDWLLELDDDEQPGYDVSLCHVLAVTQYDAIPEDEDDYLSIVADGSTATLLSSDEVTPEGLLEVASCIFSLEMEYDPATELLDRISKDRIVDGRQGRATAGDVQVEWRWEDLVLGLRFSA